MYDDLDQVYCKILCSLNNRKAMDAFHTMQASVNINKIAQFSRKLVAAKRYAVQPRAT